MAPIPETIDLPHDAAKRFTILRPLGANGPARVVLVRDRESERNLVLTIVPVAAFTTRAAEAIERRIRALVHLSHQNVVTFSYWDRQEGRLLYAVEPGEGQTLAKLFAERPVAPGEALRYLAQVATGLAAVHQKGLVHGDLRARKIFLSKGGIARLAGFRLACDGIEPASDVQGLAALTARVLARCASVPDVSRPSALLALEAKVDPGRDAGSLTASRLRNALRAAQKALQASARRQGSRAVVGGTVARATARTPIRTLAATSSISLQSAKATAPRRLLPWAGLGLGGLAVVFLGRSLVGAMAEGPAKLRRRPAPALAVRAKLVRPVRHDPPAVGVHRPTRRPALATSARSKVATSDGPWRHYSHLHRLAKASGAADARDPKKRTLLHYGARALHRRTVDEILNRGGAVNARDALGRTPLHYVCGLAKAERVALLGRAGGKAAALSPYQRILCRNDRLSPREMARVLLARGAKLEARDAKGRTPLHAAVLGARPAFVRFLIERGADVNANDGAGCGPLHLAAAAARPLSGNVRGARSLAVLENLVERGADVKAKDGKGRTPLHHACSARCREAVLILLIRQADANARDRKGQTPLHYAAQKRNRKLVEALMAGDADADVRDHKGITPRVLIGAVPPPPWPRALHRRFDALR